MSEDDLETKRAAWARRAAEHIVDGVLTAIERYPSQDRAALLREIARQAICHMPNSDDELKKLRDYFKIENLREPHPFDDELPGG
jgi:hypothetical protein